jgi:hypothetical protein
MGRVGQSVGLPDRRARLKRMARVNATRRLLTAASAAALVALFVTQLIAGVAAVDVTSAGFDAFATDLEDLIPVDQRRLLAEATEADEANDQYHPSGAQPGITPPESDIALGASFEVEMTAAVSSAEAGSGGILNCATGGTVCSASHAGQAPATSFHSYAGMMRAAPVPATGKRVEFGVVAFDQTPRDGRPAEAWEAIPEFPGDFLQGSNVAWTILSEDGKPYRLFRLEYGPGDAGFLAANTDAVAIVRGSSWAILVPSDEWDGTASDRLFVFRADDADFSAEKSVVDTSPDIADAPKRSADGPTIAVVSARPMGLSAGWLVAIGGAILIAVALTVGLVTRGRQARHRRAK